MISEVLDTVYSETDAKRNKTQLIHYFSGELVE